MRLFSDRLLGKLDDKRSVGPLIAALKGNLRVQREAVYALIEIGTPAVGPLIAALKGNNRRLVVNAAEVLGKIKDPRAIEPLIATLKDKNWVVRKEAAYALGEIKDSRAIKPLIVALQDERLSVQSRTAEALKKITGKDFGEDYNAWLKWWNEEGKKATQK